MRRARLGVVGSALDGFDHVVTSSDRLHRHLGMTMVEIAPEEFRDEFLAVRSDRVTDRARQFHSQYRLDNVLHSDLERAAQTVVALETICSRHHLDAGAMNCHVPQIRLGAEIGIAPCFALGCLTSAGIPWTCTGDVLTAIAMCLVAKFGGATLYHELEVFDYQTGELVVAIQVSTTGDGGRQTEGPP